MKGLTLSDGKGTCTSATQLVIGEPFMAGETFVTSLGDHSSIAARSKND